MKRCLILLLLAGCTKQPTLQTIGAVCNRAHTVAKRAHAERVEVVTAVKDLAKREGEGQDLLRAKAAGRCVGSAHLDAAARDIYTIVLDAQIVTTKQWAPVSEAVQAMVNTPGAEHCDEIVERNPDAFKNLRAWAEAMQQAHEKAYGACRALTKSSQGS